MQCEKFEARLQDLLDQRQRPECDAQLLEHADACDNCRETLILQEQMFAGLELWETPTLDDAFAARVVAQAVAQPRVVAKHDSTKTGRSSLPWKLVAGALAASLLVGVVTVASRWNNAAPKPHNVAKQTPGNIAPPAPAPEIEPDKTPNIAPSAEQAVATSAGTLPDHLAAQWVENAPELLDGRATGRMIREVTYSLPEVGNMEDSIPGLRPITSSFSLTIGLVRKTLPGGREQPQREDSKAAPPTKPQAEVSRDDGHASTA